MTPQGTGRWALLGFVGVAACASTDSGDHTGELPTATDTTTSEASAPDSAAPDSAAPDSGPSETTPAENSLALVAGHGGGFGNVDGVGDEARFGNPLGIAVAQGFLYVSDATRALLQTGQSNHRIRRVDPASAAVVSYSGGTYGNAEGVGTAAQYRNPGQLVFDGVQSIFLTDQDNHTIRRIDLASGMSATIAGVTGSAESKDGARADARFDTPFGIAWDATFGAGGALYISEPTRHVIRRLDLASGDVLTIAGTAGQSGPDDARAAAARFNGPAGLAVEPGVALYVADTLNHAVRRIALDTHAVTTVAGGHGSGHRDGAAGASQLAGPTSVFWQGGVVYVADTANHVIRTITPAAGSEAWSVATLAGEAGVSGADDGPDGTLGRFDSPYALTGTPERLFVVDFMGHSVRSVELASGAVTTLAGRSNRVPATDGVGAEVAFERPRALAVDTLAGAATAWILDVRVIRAVALATGTVTTIAGDRAVEALDDGVGTAAHFAQPSGLAWDGTHLFVVDPGRVADPTAPLGTPPAFAPLRQVDPASQEVRTLPLTLDYGDPDLGRSPSPNGIAAAGGVVYLSDRAAGVILRYEVTGGALTIIAGTPWQTGTVDATGADARFTGPTGLALDRAGGRLFVAEQAKHVVRAVDLASGAVTTVAGLAGAFGAADGPVATATFREPQALAFVDGTLFVADRGNSLVRAIDTIAGTVRTVAGVAGARGFLPGALPGALNRPSAVALAGGAVLVVDEEERLLARITP